jgi:formylglycine-generating enzyme required for sulfatase activity
MRVVFTNQRSLCERCEHIAGFACLRFSLLTFVCLLMLVGCDMRSTSIETARDRPARKDSLGTAPTLPSELSASDPATIHFKPFPGGKTRVGSVTSEPGRDPSMEYLKWVTVKPGDVSWSEITRAQWFAIMDPGRIVAPSEAYMPITMITWHEAVQYCQLLTLKSRVLHRLPTEIEYEHVCRGGSDELISTWKGNCPISEAITSFHRGDTGKLLRGMRVSCNVDSGKILPVGQFPPNPFNVVDTNGNCWEWVAVNDTLTSPPTPLHAPIRGGSGISTNPLDARNASRAWQPMSQAAQSIGFRVVRENNDD